MNERTTSGIKDHCWWILGIAMIVYIGAPWGFLGLAVTMYACRLLENKISASTRLFLIFVGALCFGVVNLVWWGWGSSVLIFAYAALLAVINVTMFLSKRAIKKAYNDSSREERTLP